MGPFCPWPLDGTAIFPHGQLTQMTSFFTQTLPATAKSLLLQAKALGKGGVDGWLSERLRQEEENLRGSLGPVVPEINDLTLWPSHSKTDTGRWWRSARIWLGQGGEEFYLLACGPRPLGRKLTTEEVSSARYNHVTGQLLFYAAGSPKTLSLKLQPEPAYQLLSLIQPRKEHTYA